MPINVAPPRAQIQQNGVKSFLKSYLNFYTTTKVPILQVELLLRMQLCNKVCEVARRRTVMYDDGGMNDETSATV